jgi:hypothetical protein
MLNLNLKAAKQGFFDRPAVVRALDRANRRALSRAGAFVRQRARTSMKKRKGTSPPGQPPYAHVGLLRKFLLFAYDAGKKSVVVGPARINKSGEAPALLEHGGRNQAGDFYRSNPYMGPALRQEAPNFPALWKNSVGR